jgi:hypothetical protein
VLLRGWALLNRSRISRKLKLSFGHYLAAIDSNIHTP